MSRFRPYRGSELTVEYDARRCIHAAECVHGLPGVFDPKRRPWIDPDGGQAAAVRAVVSRCPTGALVADGPLYVRGNVAVEDAEGRSVTRDVRMALCRCGASKNKPFCDNSHVDIGFRSAE